MSVGHGGLRRLYVHCLTALSMEATTASTNVRNSPCIRNIELLSDPTTTELLGELASPGATCVGTLTSLRGLTCKREKTMVSSILPSLFYITRCGHAGSNNRIGCRDQLRTVELLLRLNRGNRSEGSTRDFFRTLSSRGPDSASS